MDDLGRDPAGVMNRIRTEIMAGSYVPGDCVVQTIRQASGKTRQIVRLNLDDKWLQRVLQDILSDTLDPIFPEACQAYRPGRGPIVACMNVQQALRDGYTHYLKTDIADYFPSINLSRLAGQLESIIGKKMSDIVLCAIQPSFFTADGSPTTVMGLPLGFPLSPILSNVYLLDLDRAMDTESDIYLRFSDDILLLSRNEIKIREQLDILEKTLHGMGLSLKRRKTRLATVRGGIYYLGHLVRKDKIYEKRSDMNVQPLVDEKEIKYGDLSLQAERPEGRALEEALSDIISLNKPQGKIGEELIDFNGTTPSETISLQRIGCRVFLRTLYLSNPGVLVRVENQNAVICKDNCRENIPLRKVNQVVVLGRISMTTAFQMACLARKIPIVFISQRGHYLGILSSLQTKNTTFIRTQSSRAEDIDFRMKIARAIVKGKMASQVAFLESRRTGDNEVKKMAAQIRRLLHQVSPATTIQGLMGQEGSATRLYYAALGRLFKGSLSFSGRKRRPPPDPINAMLSFGYTLLYNDIQAILLAHGLDIGFGFLHENNPGRPNLVLDMIEELRAPIIDRLVLRTVNTGVFQSGHFQYPEGDSGGCYLHMDHRHRFLEEYEKAMTMIYRHHATGLKLDSRRIISVQAICIKKVILGSLPDYIPAELF